LLKKIIRMDPGLFQELEPGIENKYNKFWKPMAADMKLALTL
jgi:hypothetical protein